MMSFSAALAASWRIPESRNDVALRAEWPLHEHSEEYEPVDG
jgi:hypothetical protein